MKIPSIPTDNLYKFLAIFGLVIFLASIYLNDRIEEKTHIASSQLEFLQSQNKIDSLNMVIAEYSLNKILNNHNEEYLNKPNKLHDDSEIIKEFNKYRFEHKKYADSSNDVLKSHRDLVFYAKRQLRFFIYYSILGLCGFICMVVGFRQWYIKHQVYIDAERKWKGETFIELLKDAEQLRNNKSSETIIEKENNEKPKDG